MAEQFNTTVNLNDIKQFVDNNSKDYSSLLNRFVNGDETLTANELQTVYYGSPFAGCKMDKGTIALADYHMRRKDYRMAHYLYIHALTQNPVSPMLLKKAYNCTFLGAFNKHQGQQLLSKCNRICATIEATGDATTPATALQVVATEDEYYLLYNTLHVNDVISQAVVTTKENNIVVDDLTVAVPGEKAPRHYFFECYGETEADMHDFFERKKGF